MELNKLTLSDFTSLVDIMWLDNIKGTDRTAYNSGIFHIMPIPNNTGDSRRMSEIQKEQYARKKAEGDQADRLKTQKGYTKDLESNRVAMDVGITHEERTQNKYPQVLENLQSMAELPWNTIELDLQMRLSFFDATSYVDMKGETIDTTTGDGYAWGYTAHTLRGSTTTYRNILANNPRVSPGALTSMERMLKENSLDNFGKKIIGIKYDILWTTDDSEDIKIVEEFLSSVGSVEYTNPNIKNVNRYKYRHVILPRVAVDSEGNIDTSKRHYWGLISSRYSTAYIGMWEMPHVIPMYEKKDGTDSYETGVRAGYGICVVSGRGAGFSKGDGTA